MHVPPLAATQPAATIPAATSAATAPATSEPTLLILVRPKIIIQREEEEPRFGKDYDKPANLPRLVGSPTTIPSLR